MKQYFQVENLFCHGRGAYQFSLGASQCLGISGPSGCGKSLLLRALADLEPHTGSVCLKGQASHDMPASHWRKKVGLLAAESRWWADDVYTHFPELEHTQSTATSWSSELEQLGLPAAIMDWQIHRLSSGERQRLALLRLLVQQPQVLLLDEPTANLDPKHTALLEQRIMAYVQQQQVAVIWVSHDAEQLQRVANQRLMLT
ncbi:ATP-binding cassette domain-containing protein [Candidatus Venteria ishoeyi]|uniref:ABC transporter ATP-binding protein n=1 Tax=Candidatus Venteria ishoeyi TaxID=1899563 RepID=UPI0025A5C1CF|nr:ATP-binding cassette domain-containing protein [Candidatus Venteria ishoeyi]MDM8548228.1 ATP-binding cassette domain-containing protein [Candidatus Venteria ishoeyi]